MTTVPSAAPRARPLRRDAARNRELVVQASIEVFSEFGVLGTVDQVAERAGVGRATVYRSFPTRDALMNAVGLAQMARLAEIARRCQREARRPGGAFVDYVHEFFTYSRGNRLYLELFRDRMTPEVGQARDATRAVLSELIADARQAGLIRRDVIDDDFVLLATGVAVQITLDPLNAAERWERAPRLVLQALGTPLELIDRNSSA